jgi:hypothetical protein
MRSLAIAAAGSARPATPRWVARDEHSDAVESNVLRTHAGGCGSGLVLLVEPASITFYL